MYSKLVMTKFLSSYTCSCLIFLTSAMKTLKTSVDGKNDEGPPKWIEV